MSARRLVGLCLMLGVVFSATGLGADTESEIQPIPVGEILAEPDSFHLKSVTVRGTVTQLTVLDPYYQPSGAGCYGAYTFTLEDETGGLPVSVLGLCGKPVLRRPEVVDGDHIVLEAQIHADAVIGIIRPPDDSSAPGSTPDRVYGVAIRMTHEEAATSAELPSH